MSAPKAMKSSESELLEQLRGFNVSQISDALGSSHPVESGIRPIDPMFRICGNARTALCEPDDNLAVLYALEEAQKREVLVISCSPHDNSAVWGGLLSLAALSKGLAGTIVDGAVRDISEFAAIGYPVFSRCTNARRARKVRHGEHNVSVRCGSIVIRPGDVVVADINGILAISASEVEGTLAKVMEVSCNESDIREQISRGLGILKILGIEGRIKQQE
jgi:4-hydroxy-4-methyl-2-oxoglutarate aldolase